MSTTTAICPHCGAVLTIPDGCRGKKGRCRACGKIMLIDSLLTRHGASPREVLSWLTEDKTMETKAIRPSTGVRRAASKSPRQPAPAKAAVPPPVKAPPTAQATLRERFKVRLDHVDDMGAFFLFDSRLLEDEDFRSSFRKCCIICGRKDSLSVHLIIWSSKRSGTRVSNASGDYRPCVFDLVELGDAKGKDMLARLGRVEFLPEPYCLPIPYYVCDSCSPVGALVTDVRPTDNRQIEICELGISSLDRADEFAAANCDPANGAHTKILHASRGGRGHAWRMLPLAVRNRIGQWYKRKSGEIFLTYISDAEFAKAEAGVAGVVLTDQRLIYRKSISVVEMPLKHGISLKAHKAGQQVKVKITPAAGKSVTLTAEKSSAAQLETLLGQLSPHRRGVRQT